MDPARASYIESYHFKVITILTEAAVKLDLDATTFAASATLYHRFFKSIGIDDVDPFTVLMSCVHLAAKLMDKSVFSRDIINVFYQTLHPDKEPLEGGNNPVYNGLRQSLATCELFLVRAVGFNTELHLPHPHLLYQLRAIADWLPPGALAKSRLPALAWALLRDTYHAPLCLAYPPQCLSLGVIAVALRIAGTQLPGEAESRLPMYRALCPEATAGMMDRLVADICRLYRLDDSESVIASSAAAAAQIGGVMADR